VNVDRKEYLCPEDFDLGSRSGQSMQKDNGLLCALRELLAEEWNGSRILFLGDEYPDPEGIAPELFRTFYEHTVQLGYPGAYFDTMCESYRNVSGLFRDAEASVREHIEAYLWDTSEDRGVTYYNEYGIDRERPYEGLFLRWGKYEGYILNYTKRLCYSPYLTRSFDPDGTPCEWRDPLPWLLGYGRTQPPGPWLGDRIGFSEERVEGFRFLEEITIPDL
ncbi:MAG: hypothetical protein IKD79_04130, partial [Oscillospiraceae bacterium]|nr:hypothetical protein [Oscillospiraceae bacterium]